MKIIEIQPDHISEYAVDVVTLGIVKTKSDVYPSSYLDYAKADIEEGISRRSLVNALSNAKRAFHFQVDIICDAFAWERVNGKNAAFPLKLKYISNCGVISPNILLKLNKIRNSVEHDYTAPSEDELIDYIDIVELFLMATKRLTREFPESIELSLMKDEYYDEALGLPDHLNAEIIATAGGIKLSSGKESRTIEIDDACYFKWLSALIGTYLR